MFYSFEKIILQAECDLLFYIPHTQKSAQSALICEPLNMPYKQTPNKLKIMVKRNLKKYIYL